MNLARRLAAETLGTALLLIAVVGSGIMGDRLSHGNAAITLLANSMATGAALVVLITLFGPISGAHFNPVVTLAMALRGAVPWRDVVPYLIAQFAGAVAGVAAAHAMFELPLLSRSHQVRIGTGQLLSEGIAAFGLLIVVLACARRHKRSAAVMVASWIFGAYWFTASTSFANPAVTVARCLTDTFAGIRPADVPGFIIAQCVGAGAALMLWGWIDPADGAEPSQTPEPQS